MAEYDPPLEDLPIFDNLVFTNPDDYVTIGYANTHYLKFPSAQGTENLQTINVNGLATFNNDINVSDGAYIEIKDSQDNIIITDNTPTTITTANNNIIIGTDIATSITTANENVLIGNNVFLNNAFGQYNTCIGENIMIKTPSGPFSEYNTIIGYLAGKEHLGSQCVFIGAGAGEQNTTGTNTYVGVSAGTNVQGDNNIGIGNFALGGGSNLNPALNINDRNMAIGSSALYNCSTGTKNVAIGTQSLYDLTTGSKQVAIGDNCADLLQTGIDSVFIGSKASQHATSGTHCVIIGANANDDASNTTPLRNTCIGADTDNMGWIDSTAIGYGAQNTISNQIMLGTASETVQCPGDIGIDGDLIFNTTSQIVWPSTSSNYLINETPIKTVTSGINNIALGSTALTSITTGDNNIGIGRFSLNADDTGSSNICLGSGSGRFITSGGSNICIGSNTLNGVTTVNNNIAIGGDSLKTTVDAYNIGIGTAALRDSAVATECISIGYQSNMTTVAGIENTALGSYSTNGGFSTSTCIGFRSTNTANNQIRLGRATETVSCPGTLTFKLTEDNTNGIYYIPFSKVAAGTEGASFVDTATSPLSYNPSIGRLTTTEYSGSLYNNQTVNGSVGFGTVTTSDAVNIATSLSTGALSIGTGLTTGNITIGPSASGSPSSNVTIMARGGWTGTFQVGGNSASATILMAAPVTVNYPIQTSNTVAPTTTRMLGYTTTKTTGWSNITNAASNLNSITIDGTTIGFGVYRIELFINYTNGAAAQDFRIGVSTASATLQAPLCVRSTASGLDDGVLVSQTISAYTSTTFYVVAQSSNAAGATLYTSGVRNSTINLTRIA